LNSPWTSSAGRLFDAVASLIGLRQKTGYEGQAAMELEFAAAKEAGEEPYPLSLQAGVGGAGEPLVLDWAPMVEALVGDVLAEVEKARIAARFHLGLVEGMVKVARRCGQERVVLSGGCFQNRFLLENAIRCLGEAGFRPYWHQRIPPNDGGIALGQAAWVLAGRK
jgi:hydrogenase maturation protein HypF